MTVTRLGANDETFVKKYLSREENEIMPASAKTVPHERHQHRS